MSFITKRERVFNEYDLVDLPPRNEGKLKAYASCTDARAWSHFCSSKSEHLTEIIKRNNDMTVTPKYVPTKVIVDTIMVSKNIEIGRLKRKIEEFEQMLAVYEELDLDCDQKCEIAKQHATIKAANKDLDEMFLNLDTSGFTEGIDSEAFETGKSRGDAISFVGGNALTYGGEGSASIKSRGGESDRSHGDEWTYVKEMASKSNQAGLECPCDASVSVHDPRIEEMQHQIICKDAKLNAMHNSIAILENDVCEPYGIYAHIYTALEKICGIISQNPKYRQYLNLMTAGKDTRCIDIKGKILFKMKVLEKFCLALIAPCSSDFNTADPRNCTCFHAELVTRVETTFALTPSEASKGPDVKRAQLVADIMEHDEMKEILSKESKDSMNSIKTEMFEDDELLNPRYNINEENQKRIKDLQASYEELLNCYENLKHENDCLRIKCSKYDELETEFENLRSQLREYGSVWNEKEHYRKRSEDLDNLKEQYMVLAEETSGLETKLKAESEINHIKTATIDELRNQNIFLEKKISEVYIAFEKEKNALQCKLQESECKCMCQEQQIKSLSSQIVELIQQEPEKINPREETSHSIVLMGENQALKDQIKNLQDIEDEYRDKVLLINELKGEIEVWKNSFEKATEHSKYLEECIESYRDERQRLEEENKLLLKTVHDKTAAVENLMEVIANKSQEINKSTDENQNLVNKLHKLKENYEDHVTMLENEKKLALESLQVSRQESQEFLQKVKDYDEFVQNQEDLSNTIEAKMQEYESMKRVLKQKISENERLKSELANIQNNENQSKRTIELVKKESLVLERKLSKLENISQQFMDLKIAYEKLGTEKIGLENELKQKASQLDSAIYSVKLNKKGSAELLKQSEAIKNELAKLNLANESLTDDNNLLHKNLSLLREENDTLKRKSAQLSLLEQELSDLKNRFNDLLNQKKELEHDFDTKNQEINNLCNTLENKIEENRLLQEKVKTLQSHNFQATNNIKSLETENLQNQTALNAFRKESTVLMEKLQNHELLEGEYDKLKTAHEQIKLEKERLQRALDAQLSDLKRLERENCELSGQTHNLLTHNFNLEEELLTTRNQLSSAKSNPEKEPYADLLQEIQKMKDEKLAGRMKIRELLNSLDESENVLSDLKEKVCARDDKIAIMQNNINALEDEVRRLHTTLNRAIETGSEIKDTSLSIVQSRKQLEAHHSKATHNIKMELAVLQDENTKLEDQLSVTKLQTAETLKDTEKYLSLTKNLRNERNIIIADIKQLEMHSAGDSSLIPESCDLEEILSSLDRIRKSFDATLSKSTTLEQTLEKVKTSSQVFLSKADEAKKCFENEKQKIISEKEDAVQEKLNLEQKLVSLKKELEKQISHDEIVIKDLEAEIMNQKLIIDKINNSTKNYISKLEEDMQSLQDLYQNSISKVCELQEKLKKSVNENDNKENIIQKLYIDFENKSKEVAELQTKLVDLAKKSATDVGVPLLSSRRDVSSQTEVLPNHDISDILELQSKSEVDEPSKQTDKIPDINMGKRHKPSHTESNTPVSELLPQQKPPSVNEVQILSAKVEPTFDFVKSSYLNYKIKRLSQGQLEHHSIPYLGESIQSTSVESPEISDHLTGTTSSKHKNIETQPESQNKVDSKVVGSYDRPPENTKTSPEITQTQDSQMLQLTNDSFGAENGEDSKLIQNNIQLAASNNSTDLLVIYRDSESNFGKKTYNQEEVSSNEKQQKTSDKVTKLPTKYTVSNKSRNKRTKYVNNPQAFYAEIDEARDDNNKPKLSIDLPRVVDHDSISLVTMSDSDKKSVDSYTILTPQKRFNLSDSNIMLEVSPKDIEKYESHSTTKISNNEDLYEESHNSTNLSTETTKSLTTHKKDLDIKNSNKNIDKPNYSSGITTEKKYRTKPGKKSHHKLSRVEADVFLIKSKSNQHDNWKANDQGKQNDFALEYILDTVIKEGDLHKLSTYGADSILQRTRSDESHSTKINERRDSYQSTEFSPSRSKTSERSHTISVERSVMVKLDATSEYYEQIIQDLRNTLENVEIDYKKKIEAIKVQYDRNINNIINEHNQGVKNMQSLHEETLQDIMKVHENEVDNLRAMSMEAMRKADKLEKEKLTLKIHSKDNCNCNSPVLDEVPTRVCSPELRRRKHKTRPDTKMLTKTTVEAFNVKPRTRLQGLCTCSLDVNISDTIRNIFEQVDVEQRKMAEMAYLKYIANKISNGNIEGLDAQELSFLHLKVCRTWKQKLGKEEALQKKIDSLEVELINKQRNTQQHMADLDRKVAEEKRKLEEVREAVCRSTPANVPEINLSAQAAAERDFSCGCDTSSEFGLMERRSAGDLVPTLPSGLRQKRTRTDSNRAVLARLDVEERRERKLYSDEPPTRLRRQHERLAPRPHKK